MTKVRKQVPALAALVDFWWQGVWQDVEPFGLSPRWRQWVQECLLPLVDWEHQVAHTRCARRKAKMCRPWRRSAPRLTRTRSPEGWTPRCLRSGTRGRASGSRPLRVPRRLSKGATAICHKCITIIVGCPSGATKCGPSCITLIVALRMARPGGALFGRSFPDLFETALSHIDASAASPPEIVWRAQVG